MRIVMAYLQIAETATRVVEVAAGEPSYNSPLQAPGIHKLTGTLRLLKRFA